MERRGGRHGGPRCTGKRVRDPGRRRLSIRQFGGTSRLKEAQSQQEIEMSPMLTSSPRAACKHHRRDTFQGGQWLNQPRSNPSLTFISRFVSAGALMIEIAQNMWQQRRTASVVKSGTSLQCFRTPVVVGYGNMPLS